MSDILVASFKGYIVLYWLASHILVWYVSIALLSISYLDPYLFVRISGSVSSPHIWRPCSVAMRSYKIAAANTSYLVLIEEVCDHFRKGLAAARAPSMRFLEPVTRTVEPAITVTIHEYKGQ